MGHLQGLLLCFIQFVLTIILPLILIITSTSTVVAANQKQTYLSGFCTSGNNFTANSTYEKNLDSLVSSFSNTDVDGGFYNSSAGEVKARALCRGDLSPEECRTCIYSSAHHLRFLCPNDKEAIIFYDTCMFYYSDSPISGVLQILPYYVQATEEGFSDVTQANAVLQKLFSGLRKEAAAGGPFLKYAVGEAAIVSDTVYALVQCTPDLEDTQCGECLYDLNATAVESSENLTASGRKALMVVGPSCNFRYATYLFYHRPSDAPSPSPSPSPSQSQSPTADDQSPIAPDFPSPASNANTTSAKANGNKTRRIVLITVIPILVLIILVVSMYFVLRMAAGRTEVIEIPANDQDNDESRLDVESLSFKLSAIKDATDNFSSANKLGSGGFGDVFKGILPDGQEIAVKRLSVGSNQGDAEFKNEVLFLAKLQHRNLIKLIGFCLEGGEKLLIYEFVPNSSLDHFIFDTARSGSLDWEKRDIIIRGIARGLHYLHEESSFRIIHRDLKASNILLDANLNPQISDFGLAKLFPMNQTHVNTRRIAGTYGYMAPEYAYHGQFSVKSDVYSFGILVLEILCGRKIFSQIGEELQHLVGYAWRKWNEGTILDVVDPTLRLASSSEIMRCFHIALLCVQESASNRPTMSSVVTMLNNNYTSLPLPSRPGFLLHSITHALEHDSHRRNPNPAEQFSQNGASITDPYPR